MRYHVLPAAIILEVSGKDAQRYLNNRLTYDVRSASDGSEFIAAALSPQGRTEGLFEVRCIADKFLLVCDAGDRDTVIKAFSRYKVADRVEIVDLSAKCSVIHIFEAEKFNITNINVITTIKRARITAAGLDLIVAREDLNSACLALDNQGGQVIESQEFESLRISRGFPQFPLEINDQSIILETGPKEAVSFGKGCYVGQEVIERVDSMGRLPKELIRVKAATEFQREFPITLQSGKVVGEVVSVALDQDSSAWFGFGLVKSGALNVGDQIKIAQSAGEVVE